MKRLLLVGLLGVGLVTSVPLAHAAGAYDWKLTTRDSTDTSDLTNQFIPSDTYFQFLVNEFGTRTPQLYTTGDEFTFLSSKEVIIDNLPQSRVANLVSDLAGKASTSSVETLASNLSDLSNIISSLPVAGGLNREDVTKFMSETATTSLLVATSTFNGFMSAADKVKLDALSTSSSASFASRSITTGTGATGFQISASRDSDVHYSGTITTTATIGSGQIGTLVLEMANTNSATAGDWTEIGRCTNGQTITLAIALQSVQTIGCQLSGFIPAGKYAKIRSISTTGTPSFAYNSGQEVLK